MKLMNITFEGSLRPKQKNKFTPLEIKFSEKINPNSDDDKYVKRHQERLVREDEELLLKTQEEQRRLKGKDRKASE